MTVNKPPKVLRPYISLGINPEWEEGNDEAVAQCPWCDREGKFSINLEKETWRCFVCQTGSKKFGGNIYTLLRLLREMGLNSTTEEQYEEFALERRVSVEGLKDWEIFLSPLTDEWIIPGYNIEGALCQLYRYAQFAKARRPVPLPTLNHKIHGLSQFNREAPNILVAEGPWDGIALSDANKKSGIGREYTALAVPGCNAPVHEWSPLFAGKIVSFMYDSDYPRENPKTGKITPPAGFSAIKRVSELLSAQAEPPKEIQYLEWGPDGYDPNLPDGTDVKDFLSGKVRL